MKTFLLTFYFLKFVLTNANESKKESEFSRLTIKKNSTINDNIDEIKTALKFEIIKKCTYDSNPVIVEICPRYQELLPKDSSEENETFIEGSRFKTMNDIENVIVNEDIIKELIEKCDSNVWCLNQTLIEFSSSLLSNYGKSFCLAATCFDELKQYIDNCAQSELTKYLLDILPLLCKIYLENIPQNYCLDDTLKLINVVYARDRKALNSIKDFNVCKANKGCNDECQKVSKQLHRFQSCCYNIDLVRE